MANKSKFEPSARLHSAIALSLEQDPKKWGSTEHLSMLRYLVLACSDKAKMSLAELKAVTKDAAGKESPVDFELKIKWSDLRAEFMQDSKLAEAANFYKFLQESEEMETKEKRMETYA